MSSFNGERRTTTDMVLAGTMGTDDQCDLDYSQTHLEDFLKSQTKGTYAQHLQSG